jgi:hypothetical protein
MTKYGADEVEGWEFKIVRASTSKFSAVGAGYIPPF